MTSFDKICIAFLKALVKVWLRVCYRFHAIDTSNIPQEGPVLLIGNHFTFIDALLVYSSSKRPVRFIADQAFLPKKNFIGKYVTRALNTIAFEPGNKKSAVQMIRAAQEGLQNGEAICIFPEGALTRDTQVRAFQNGFLTIMKKTPEVPIVPFGIVGFYGSRFAYAKMKGYKAPRAYRPCIAFGKPFDLKAARAAGQSDAQISQRLLHIVQELCVDACDLKTHPENVWILSPARSAIRGLRRFPKEELFLADSTGKELTSRRALLEILVLRNVCHRILGNDPHIGVLLPTSVASVLVNAALSFDNRVPVNLNYTLTNEVLNYCTKKVGVKKILASAQLLKKLPKLQIDAEMLILEDLAKKEIRKSDKLYGAFLASLPTWILERMLGIAKQKLSDINTLIFTSGSTGMPKGTILTNMNIMANCQSFMQSSMAEKSDSLYGTLPFFHSFGYTVTLWFPLTQNHRCVYHFNPLDYKAVGATAKKYRPTLMVSTPTFAKTYLRKCAKEDFESIDFPILGAEKIPKGLIDAWREKFGTELSEGYGATETAPVSCHSIPTHRSPDKITPYHIDGSIGTPDPNFVIKVVNTETGEEMPPNEPGMLYVKGNSVTPGYYEDPEHTAKIFKDGWYVSGDVARIDEHNFIYITGRESRISKIGGEMAPHVLIEERLNEAIKALALEKGTDADNEDGPNYHLVVTAVPDEKKGEKLVVLYETLQFTPEEICKKTSDLELLPPIWIPATINFKQIDHIPVLGTGKLDLKGMKKLALEIYNLDSEL